MSRTDVASVDPLPVTISRHLVNTQQALGPTTQQVLVVLLEQAVLFDLDVDDIVHAERLSEFGRRIPVWVLIKPRLHSLVMH